jgi:hypothetical protein
VLLTLIDSYENKHCDFSPAHPVKVISFRMVKRGPNPRDFKLYIAKSG